MYVYVNVTQADESGLILPVVKIEFMITLDKEQNYKENDTRVEIND